MNDMEHFVSIPRERVEQMSRKELHWRLAERWVEEIVWEVDPEHLSVVRTQRHFKFFCWVQRVTTYLTFHCISLNWLRRRAVRILSDGELIEEVWK